MKLNIGSSSKKREGYLSCDIRDVEGVDVVCSSDNLPFEDNTIEEIYSRHNIEHYTLKEAIEVLTEWNRVLERDGIVYIICPNLLFHLQQILEGKHESLYNKERGKNDRYWGFGSLFGWQQNEFDVHKFGFYFELLKDLLEDRGFYEVEDLTNKEESLEKAPWHLEVRAKKQKTPSKSSESKFWNLLDVKH